MTQAYVLITGAQGGIGAAIVNQLKSSHASNQAANFDAGQVSDQFARNFVTWDQPQLTSRADVSSAPHAKASQVNSDITCDITDAVGVQTAVTQLVRERGVPEAVIHCAGIVAAGPALKHDAATRERIMEVNYHGAVNVLHAVAQAAIEAQVPLTLLAVASNAASTPRHSMAAYSASKAALVAHVKALSLEFGHAQIRCNTISPGTTDTHMLRELGNPDLSAVQATAIAGNPAQFKAGIPLGRVAAAQDIAAAALFLISRQARHITGCNLVVDGGAT